MPAAPELMPELLLPEFKPGVWELLPEVDVPLELLLRPDEPLLRLDEPLFKPLVPWLVVLPLFRLPEVLPL